MEPHEGEKIRTIVKLIEDHVDTDGIISALSGESQCEQEKGPGRFRRFIRKVFHR